jgi:hypothetical protein
VSRVGVVENTRPEAVGSAPCLTTTLLVSSSWADTVSPLPSHDTTMSEIDASELLPNEHVRRMVADGEITQMHRGHAYADEGDRFEIDGTTFEVTAVEHRTLGDLTDEDARAEGSENLEAYKRRLERVHDEFEWDDDSEVVRHGFEPVEG